MVGNLAVIALVSPAELGLWQSMLLIQAYAGFIQLGVMNGLNRELPFSLGAADEERVRRLVGTAQFIALACSAIALFVLLIVFVSAAAQGLEENMIAGLVAAILILAEFFYVNYLQVTFRAQRSFIALARVQFIQSAVVLATIPIVYQFGFKGLLMRVILNDSFFLFMTHSVRPFRIRPHFDRESLMLLCNTGLPLFLAGYLMGVSYTFPRVLLLNLQGVHAVGIFAPAEAIINAAVVLPSILAQYLYPQMSYTLGKSSDPTLLWPWAWKSALSILIFSAPVVLLGWFFVPKVIETFFPNYRDGIFAAQMALVIGSFKGAMIATNVLNSMKAWTALTIVTGSALTLAWLFPFEAAGLMNPIDGVAAGTALARCLVFCIAMFCIYRAIFKTKNARTIAARKQRRKR